MAAIIFCYDDPSERTVSRLLMDSPVLVMNPALALRRDPEATAPGPRIVGELMNGALDSKTAFVTRSF